MRLALAERCALWIATVDGMYLRERTNLAPALGSDDPRLAGHAVRGHVSLKGVDNVRRFYGILAQNEADAEPCDGSNDAPEGPARASGAMSEVSVTSSGPENGKNRRVYRTASE